MSTVQLLKNAASGLTFRMRTPLDGEPGGELILDENDYTFDVDNGSKRYTPEQSGIVVEVKDSTRSSEALPEALRKSLPTMPSAKE